MSLSHLSQTKTSAASGNSLAGRFTMGGCFGSRFSACIGTDVYSSPAQDYRGQVLSIGEKVRRGKALDFSGCNSCPQTGSLNPVRNRSGSGRGRNETLAECVLEMQVSPSRADRVPRSSPLSLVPRARRYLGSVQRPVGDRPSHPI
jgi:hypothetical protein